MVACWTLVAASVDWLRAAQEVPLPGYFVGGPTQLDLLAGLIESAFAEPTYLESEARCPTPY